MIDGHQVLRVDDLFDTKLTFSSVVDKLAKKARGRLGALKRLKPMLDSVDMEQMCTMFIRSILEHGSLVYMGAANSHLEKLERVQQSKIGGFEVESLHLKQREAAAISFALDLLDGNGYGGLQDYAPTVIEPLKLSKKRTRQSVEAGLQLKRVHKAPSLDQYKQSHLGSIHKIWSKLPQKLISEGNDAFWGKNQDQSKTISNWEMDTRTKKCR